MGIQAVRAKLILAFLKDRVFEVCDKNNKLSIINKDIHLSNNYIMITLNIHCKLNKQSTFKKYLPSHRDDDNN